MRFSVITLGVLFIASLDGGKARAQTLEWARSFGSSGTDYGFIDVDALGNVYTTGWFDGTVDLDPGIGTTSVTSLGDDDIYLQSMDASGAFRWAVAIGTNAEDRANAIHVDGSGNVYTTGFFSGTMDFDPGPGMSVPAYVGGQDVFVQKWDASGNSLWVRSFGGSSSEDGFNIHVDGSGNVYTTGYFAGTVDLDPGPGTYTLSSQGERDVFIQKMDGSGNFLWARAFGSPGDDFGYSVAVDATGNVITTGGFQGTVDIDPGTGTSTVTSEGSSDIFILKLDPSGDLLWARTFGDLEYDTGYSLALDVNGDIITTGYFRGTVDLDPGIGVQEFISVGANDIFILKLDPSGDLIWARSFGDAGDDAVIDIAMDSGGHIVAMGWFQGQLNLGSGTNIIDNSGFYDAFVAKFDPLGNTIWAGSMGGTGLDLGMSICLDNMGTAYTAGVFEGIADLDPEAGVSNLTSVGDKDVFVQKLSPTSTGLVDPGQDLQITVFPSLGHGVLQITCQEAIDDVDVILSDMVGKVQRSVHFDTFSGTELLITGAPGAYHVCIRTSAAQRVVKVIKE